MQWYGKNSAARPPKEELESELATFLANFLFGYGFLSQVNMNGPPWYNEFEALNQRGHHVQEVQDLQI